jgi:hypothetical protein
VPPEIPGLGSSALVLRVTPGFDPLKAGVGPDEYFVLSRVDGKLTLREILLSTGLPVDRGIAIIGKLRSIGALLMPGEGAPKPQPAVARTVTPPTPQPRIRTPNLRPPVPPPDVPTHRLPPNILNPQVDAPTMRRSAVVTPPTPAPVVVYVDPLPDPTPAEQYLLAEQNDIGIPERKRILSLARLVNTRDYHLLIGTPRGADAKTLKRTYFKLSKEIHPDRFYGKNLGSFKDMLSQVFEAVSRAYEKLTSPEAARNSGVFPTVGADQPQTPQEYAAELFDRACELEVSGDALEAMKLFSAAVRIESQPRYLRRAASCAIAAGQPKTALEYAKKAQAAQPNDPSVARLLAAAFRAAGKLGDAEEVLVMAMAMKSENDALAGELRNDLADIRRLLAASE